MYHVQPYDPSRDQWALGQTQALSGHSVHLGQGEELLDTSKVRDNR